MRTYAKLTETDQLETLARVPHVVNATEEQFATYAAANGYKELIRTDSPGHYYTPTYTESTKVITQSWNPVSLDEAKVDALSILQSRRDARMNNVVIPCTALPNGILYNTEAMTMAQGLLILQSQGALPEGTTWTDAADDAHTLTPELLTAITQAMLTHVNTTQAVIQVHRDAVKAAVNVDEVEQAIETLTF